MKTADFNFDLPDELIAQSPSSVRGEDKLLVMDRITGKIEHHMMNDLPDLIDSNTLMVFNDSKVRRSRCYAKKIQSIESRRRGEQASSVPIEFMVLSFIPDLRDENGKTTCAWKCMVKNAKKQKAGCRYSFLDGTIGTIAEYAEFEGSEFRALVFDRELDESWFERNGHVPLPPYIKRKDNETDSERYQNVYAKEIGSSACPTAGLHFTQEMLETLKNRGIEREFVTLHVGLGTFLPVRVENIEEHRMHEEFFTITPETARKITDAKRAGKKILAVGTTSVRTLESAWDSEKNCLRSGTYSTKIFIYPGYEFKVVDQLFTNFHTPESTLMMLVSAFSSREKILAAYKVAIENRYRFFSYGDACLFR